MSVTSQYPSIVQWFRLWLAGQPHQVIGGLDDPYLRRWYVIPRNPWLNIYVHHFLRSDDDRALHDHPWWFVSLMLRGRYAEITDQGTRWRRAGSIAFRPATWRHRVQLDSNSWVSDRELPCWTLIVTGRRSRTWGFWCKKTLFALSGRHVETERFVPWQQWDESAGCGELS